LKKSIAWQLDYTKLIGNYYEEIKFIDGFILKRFYKFKKCNAQFLPLPYF